MTSQTSSVTLSHLDRRIIEALQSDGRKPVVDIAVELGIPASTVRRHLRRLLDDGALRIVAIPDNERLGLPIHVIMRIETDLTSGATVGEALERLPEVRWVAMVAGQSDYLIEAFFRSNAELHDFTMRKLTEIAGIQRTETITVLRLFKNSYDWASMQGRGAD